MKNILLTSALVFGLAFLGCTKKNDQKSLKPIDENGTVNVLNTDTATSLKYIIVKSNSAPVAGYKLNLNSDGTGEVIDENSSSQVIWSVSNSDQTLNLKFTEPLPYEKYVFEKDASGNSVQDLQKCKTLELSVTTSSKKLITLKEECTAFDPATSPIADSIKVEDSFIFEFDLKTSLNQTLSLKVGDQIALEIPYTSRKSTNGQKKDLVEIKLLNDGEVTIINPLNSLGIKNLKWNLSENGELLKLIEKDENEVINTFEFQIVTEDLVKSMVVEAFDNKSNKKLLISHLTFNDNNNKLTKENLVGEYNFGFNEFELEFNKKTKAGKLLIRPDQIFVLDLFKENSVEINYKVVGFWQLVSNDSFIVKLFQETTVHDGYLPTNSEELIQKCGSGQLYCKPLRERHYKILSVKDNKKVFFRNLIYASNFTFDNSGVISDWALESVGTHIQILEKQ